MKRRIFFVAGIILLAGRLFALDVVKVSNRDFLTLEETLELAEKEPKKNKLLISNLNFLVEVEKGLLQTDIEEINSVIDRCPYMPCTEGTILMFLSPKDILNSANYIYSVFTGCPKENELKDQVYLKILEASVKENNFDWSFNAARDLSEKAKESDTYKDFLAAKNR